MESTFFETMGRPWIGNEVFDLINDTVYFVKNWNCRYVWVSQPLVERCGMNHKNELIGKTTMDLFPTPMGERFIQQDNEVVNSGEPIVGELELHLYPNAASGWCLTWKEPITDDKGNVVGLSGISRDLNSGVEFHRDLHQVASVLNHIRENLSNVLHVEELAEISKLSPFQLDSRVRALFGVSTCQYISRSRIDLACSKLMKTTETIIEIARMCGYSDASSFTRQFRKMVGITPSNFRESAKIAKDSKPTSLGPKSHS